MTWQRRLFELVCAGGVLAATPACFLGPTPCGNANPDPCICGRMPANSPTCEAEAACKDKGGYWDVLDPGTNDAGAGVEGHCVLPTAGSDGGILPDAARPDGGPLPDAARPDGGPLPDAAPAPAKGR